MTALPAKISTLGRSSVPLERGRSIDRSLPPVLVILTEEMHGARMPAGGGEPKPGKCRGSIFRHTAPARQQMGVVIDGPVAIIRSRPVIPLGSFLVIDRCPEPVLVAPSDHVDSERMSCACCFHEPIKRTLRVACGTNTIDQELAEQQ